MQIDPEKITDALIDDYMKFRLGPDDPLIWQEHFQGLCDLLIKHGLVSPPVWVIRYLGSNLPVFFSSKELAEERDREVRLKHDIKPGEVTIIHWKGQTTVDFYAALGNQLNAAVESFGLESDEAEAIRIRMDHVWKNMTTEEQNEAKKL
jgi:hypothetical protein